MEVVSFSPSAGMKAVNFKLRCSSILLAQLIIMVLNSCISSYLSFISFKCENEWSNKMKGIVVKRHIIIIYFLK